MIDFFVLIHRFIGAATTFPTAEVWQEMGWLFLLMTILTLPFGWFTGFLVPRLCPLPKPTIALIVVGSFFTPALGEEIVFRVLPIPLPTESDGANTLLWAAASLIVFVLYHPARSWLFPKPRYRVFRDGRFLVLASVLGLFCTIAYLRSGSLWPPVLFHWLFVIVWLVLFGGYERCSAHSDLTDDGLR